MARALAPLVEDGERVVVACSGGPDSVATLVATVRALGASRVIAAHYDHRLRSPEEARREREVVQAVADALGVRLRCGRPSRRPSSTTEDAARQARYRWLARLCVEVESSACVTGHTLEDQAETVLLRLARGTSGAGAAGMDLVAGWPVSVPRAAGLRLLRPLLGISRTDVEAYLAALGVEAARDPSNDTLQYARNRVRQQVLPPLRAVNARAAEHLARFAEQQREDEALLVSLTEDWLAEHAYEVEDSSLPAVALGRRALRAAPRAVQRRAVWLAAMRLGLALEGSHIDAILQSLRRSGACTTLPMGYAQTRATELRLHVQRRPRGGSRHEPLR